MIYLPNKISVVISLIDGPEVLGCSPVSPPIHLSVLLNSCLINAIISAIYLAEAIRFKPLKFDWSELGIVSSCWRTSLNCLSLQSYFSTRLPFSIHWEKCYMP